MDIENILFMYEDDYNPGPRPMAQGRRIGLVEGGLLKTGPNTGKYVLRSKIDGERARRFFDTKKEFDEAVKISKANKGGGARDMSERISKPTNSEIEISEKVYGDKYNKKGEELWKSLTGKERGGIRQGTTTGGKKGPEGLGVNEEGKPIYQVKREKALKRNAPFFQKGTKDFQFHHIMNIGGEIPLDTNDIAIISEKMNRTLAPYNRKLNNIADNISTLFNDQPKDYLKEIDKLNSEGESIIKKAIKDLPKEYRNLIGFNKVVPVTDEYGTVVDIASEKIGGSNIKKPGIKLEKLTNKQATALRKQIRADAAAGNITSGMKLSSNPFFDPSLMGKVISDIGKGINVGLGPTGMIALTKYLEPEGGYDLSRTGDRLGFEAEAALAKPLVSGAVSVTDKIKNPMLRKIAERAALAGMSPAMAMKIASRLSPVGIATLAGEAIYNVGKLGYEDQQRFNALSPEEQAAERAEQEKFAFNVEGS